MTVEKLYLRTPSCVQDNVDTGGFSPPSAAIPDWEKQPGFRHAITSSLTHGISTPSRPRGPTGAAFRRSSCGHFVVPGVVGPAGCGDPTVSDAVSLTSLQDENHPRPHSPPAVALRPSTGQLVVQRDTSSAVVTRDFFDVHRSHHPRHPGYVPGSAVSKESEGGTTVRLTCDGLACSGTVTPQVLGRYTKSSPPPPPVDGRRRVRAERYELLSTARNLLLAKGRAAGLAYPANYSRTAKCMHTPHGEVAVLRGVENGAAFFQGLVTCGSVWACPVCAAKVQERRREEIAKGFDWAYAEGLQPVMVTLTFPHRAWHELSDLVLQQRAALKMLRKGRGWDKFMKLVGYQGLIRALEITHGRNGWHPHTHEVWMVGAEVKAEDLVAQISSKWALVCMRAGLLKPEQLEDFLVYAVDVKGWCSASDYLAKADDAKHWGADREMAKGSTKAGRAKGMHPFGLLAKASTGDRRSGELFIEFVDTMKATRSRQLFWSPGLKEKVGLEEKTDQELVDEEHEPADLVGLIGRSDWENVRHQQKRAQLLDAAELGGWPTVLGLLESLRSRRPVQIAHPC